MDSDKRSTKTAGSKKENDDKGKYEDGEEKPKLALEEFFEQYVDKWYKEKKLHPVLYNRCRKEIDKLKGKVQKSKIQKPKKISNENLNDEHTVRQLPDFDEKKQQMGRTKHPQELVNIRSKEKPSPASVSQEQCEMMTKEIKEQDAMDQKYQKALHKIQKLEDEMAELRMENDSISRGAEQLKGELKRSYAQINEIQTRLKKLASETLSDPYRPTALAKQFSELYDNEWSEAYEIFTTSLKCSEEETLQILFDTVERAFEFMEEQRQEQVQLIRRALLYPAYFVLTMEGTKMEDLTKFISKADMEIQIKEIRKTHAPTTAKILANLLARKTQDESKAHRLCNPDWNCSSLTTKYRKWETPQKHIGLDGCEPSNHRFKLIRVQMGKFPCIDTNAIVFRDIEVRRLCSPHEKIINTMPEALKTYAYRCAQLCWHMVIADPPIYMTKSVAKKPFNLDVYRPYTKSIKGMEKVVVETDVWPALYLYPGGPLLNKGVAQPGYALRK